MLRTRGSAPQTIRSTHTVAAPSVNAGEETTVKFDHGFDVRFSSLLGKRRITTRGLWATRCVSQCFDGSLESITSKTAPYNDASRYSADTTRGCRTYTFRNQRTAPFAGTVKATGLPQQQQYTGSLERYLLASGRRTINIYL